MLLVVYSILILWVLIYLINYLFGGPRKHRPFFLPTNVSPGSPIQVVLKPFHLMIDTTVFNPVLDVFSARLYNQPFLQESLRRFYDIGNFFSTLGMIAIIGLLSWTTVKLLSLLLQVPVSAPYEPRPLSKRDLVAVSAENSKLPFHLIVPGLTVPLSHLPLLLCVLFMGQTVHELGHAVSAAVESVPLTSAGASLFVIIPSAFVSLSIGTFQRLLPLGRLRIVSAGAFHNLFAWTALVILGWIGVGSTFLSIFYADVTQQGRVVVSIDHDSPLKGYLPIGVVVTKLNDYPLTLPNPVDTGESDVWSRYFLEHDSIRTSDLGWCVEEEWFLGRDSICCTPRSPQDHVQSCFTTSVDGTAGHCIDPVPLLTDTKDSKRCNAARPCNLGSVCARPSTIEKLLRITFKSEGLEKVVLWSGPALEVYEQVEVGYLLPRTFLSPIWLPRLSEISFMYLKTVMLSLYFVNLLPLPFLDGDQVLAITAELIFKGNTGGQELEAAERGFRSWSIRNEGRTQRRRYLFKAGVQIATWTAVVLSILLTALYWYR